MNEQSISRSAHPPLKMIFKVQLEFPCKTILHFNLSIAVWQFWDLSTNESVVEISHMCWSKKNKKNIIEYSTFHPLSTLL